MKPIFGIGTRDQRFGYMSLTMNTKSVELPTNSFEGAHLILHWFGKLLCFLDTIRISTLTIPFRQLHLLLDVVRPTWWHLHWVDITQDTIDLDIPQWVAHQQFVSHYVVWITIFRCTIVQLILPYTLLLPMQSKKWRLATTLSCNATRITHCSFVLPEENWPPSESGFSQAVFFSPFGHLIEFWFVATVALAFGLLSWGNLIFNNIIDLCSIIFMLSLWSCFDTIFCTLLARCSF